MRVPVRLEHPSNASLPIVVTELGIDIVPVSPEQLKNTELPMEII
jgi:hypothetical protein